MKNIALGFSGGGFRAAAFSLGALSYLYYAEENGKLLKNVKFIGSTSGGSITNMAYSVMVHEKEFPAIYEKLLNFLEGQTLISKVFEILYRPDKWKDAPDKSRNLINAFALAYDELLFGGKPFGSYDNLINTHLEEVCINSTELTNGLSFRYQSQSNKFVSGLIGNGYINFKNDATSISKKIKLADILATSSCFPAGFEPFVFPEDFSYDNLSKEELANAINFRSNPFTTSSKPDDPLNAGKKKKRKNRFGLLDGGIADNQAIDSILLANGRRIQNKRPPFDLLIITDVTSYFIDGYNIPSESSGMLGRISIKLITNIILYMGLLFPVLIGVSMFIGWHALMYLFFLPSLVMLATYIYGKFIFLGAKVSASKNKSTWNLMLFSYGAYFLQLKLNSLFQMLVARLKSVTLMTVDIFMKKIRSMYYKQLYSDAKLRNIVVSNAIYDLSKAKQKIALEEKGRVIEELGYNEFFQTDTGVSSEVSAPADCLIDTAEKARLVATTLWFDRYQCKDQLKAVIVATGQFTTCYNLLKYLAKKEKKAAEDSANQTDAECLDSYRVIFDDEDRELKDVLVNHWSRFNVDPFWLYNDEKLRPKHTHQLKTTLVNKLYVVTPF